ncbi:MAG: hypothetical protein V1867_08550 [Candidatus Falkowbacteria bacterium]
MNSDKAIKNINRALYRKEPPSIDSLWVKRNCRTTYFFIEKNVKTELGETDWDRVVFGLDRPHQKLWMKGVQMSKRQIDYYEDEKEVNRIMKKYKHKLYTFFCQENEDDKRVCDLISIRLVRTAQRGNRLAHDKVIELAGYLVNQWLETDARVFNWRGYDEKIKETIKGCVRRYRYTGSFIGYLHKTMEYSGRGLLPGEVLCLDEVSPATKRRKIDNVVHDRHTGGFVFFIGNK